MITHYRQQFNKDHVWLIGYSFGANVLPTIINQLSPENRQAIFRLSLLEPTDSITFEFELESYMKKTWWDLRAQAVRHWLQPVTQYSPLPALKAFLPDLPVFCYYSKRGTANSVCTEPDQRIARKGGLYFDEDFEGLARKMLSELQETTPQSDLAH